MKIQYSSYYRVELVQTHQLNPLLRAVVVCRKQTTTPATAVAGQDLHLPNTIGILYFNFELVRQFYPEPQEPL